MLPPYPTPLCLYLSFPFPVFHLPSGSVLSKHLTWLPQGSEYPPNQSSKYTTFSQSQADVPALRDAPPHPVHPDIVLARLRPGQVSQGECQAGRWLPVRRMNGSVRVATAWGEQVHGGSY